MEIILSTFHFGIRHWDLPPIKLLGVNPNAARPLRGKENARELRANRIEQLSEILF
jgi:hypothetical protein